MTSQQNRDFISSIIDTYLLDNAIEWIQNHLNPQDVFDADDLHAWAAHREPEEIFSFEQLSDWAEAYGFKKI